MHKALLALLCLFTYATLFTQHAHAQDEITLKITNNETVKRNVYVYGKNAEVKTTQDPTNKITHIQFITSEPSKALLPAPVTIPPGETVTVSVPVPRYEPMPIVGETNPLPVHLYQLDLRIQYFLEWCRLQFPFNNEISWHLKDATKTTTPYPTEFATTTRQIAQGLSSFGTWTT